MVTHKEAIEISELFRQRKSYLDKLEEIRLMQSNGISMSVSFYYQSRQGNFEGLKFTERFSPGYTGLHSTTILARMADEVSGNLKRCETKLREKGATW